MTTTKEKASEKCDQPATAIVKLGDKEAPACEKHIEAARKLSAKAGKNPVPKGLTKAQHAAYVGRNADDALPITVRALTEIEKENEPRCLAHHLEV